MTATASGEKLHITLNAKDALSTIDRAEYSVDAGHWLYLEPVGKLSDAKEEHYDFVAAVPSPDSSDDASADDADAAEEASGKSSEKSTVTREHVVTVRVYDHYGNVTAAKAVVH
jgi:dipeptidyl aminopeptidase/acylaminoacyl peptidase